MDKPPRHDPLLPRDDDADAGLTLRDLCLAAGIDARTFRYWIHARLLPPIDKTGPGVRYPMAYLHAVRRIQELQRQGHSLQAIARLMAVSGQGPLADLDTKTADPDRQRRQLLQDLLGARPANVRIHGGLTAPPAGSAPAGAQSEASPAAKSRTRSAWDHYLLRPGIELHVQRPLDRDTQRKLDHLLDQAARLFSPAGAAKFSTGGAGPAASSSHPSAKGLDPHASEEP